MKFDIFKFLVKFFLSTALVSTMIPGYIDGMEQGPCAICLEPVINNVYQLNCNGVAGVNHNFHLACIKGWIKVKAKCPMCQRELGQQKLDDLSDLTRYQQQVVNQWNNDARAVCNRGGIMIRRNMKCVIQH